jgi:hypothetical protein
MSGEKIPIREKKTIAEGALIAVETARDKTIKTLLDNAGTIVSIFLLFVVGVVMTTDISVKTAAESAAVGLEFYALMFCSYGMYINTTGSGKKQGLLTNVYLEANNRYEELKRKIKNGGLEKKLSEFCQGYVQYELRNARTLILANVGISYETYEKHMIGRDVEKLDLDEPITDVQKKAVRKANRLKPIKLTPEMIIQKDRAPNRRSPLGVNPHTKKMFTFALKAVTTGVTALLMIRMAFSVLTKPSWGMFASVLLKMLAVMLNGFMGYQFGYEHITVTTVSYMNSQSDLMEQVLQYAE